MTPQKRSTLSEQAIEQLKDVFIDILQEAAEHGQCLGAAEIGRKAGIPRLPAGGVGGTRNWNDGLQTHILNLMLLDGTVARCPLKKGGKLVQGQRGWKIV